MLAAANGMAAFAVACVLVYVGGRRLLEVQHRPNPFHGKSIDDNADAIALLAWGAMVFTIGCYALRAAF